jgi:hypothetical protein
MTSKINEEVYFEYYDEEFPNVKDRISYIGSILNWMAQQYYLPRIKFLTSQDVSNTGDGC